MKKKVAIFSIMGVVLVILIINTVLLLNNKMMPLGADIMIRDFAYDIRGDKFGFGYWFFRILTELGYFTVIIPIVIVCFVIWKLDLRSLMLAAGSLFAYVLNTCVKLLFNRERPIADMRWMDESSSSYPSGHSSSVMTTYLLLAYFITISGLSKKTKIILNCVCGLIILIVGFSRIILGVHYFTDIIGGFCCGAIVALSCVLLYDFLKKKGFNFLKNKIVKE